MKFGILVIGLLLIAATIFLLPMIPSLASLSYVMYAGYGLGGLLVLAGLLGKNKRAF